ncbi:D-alanine transaminase [Chitinivorax tropicus]|uniref:D-alanine transaminase n=1 Tax=Chitinivorax tropicus TaxID=714531 RepID=A0A840MRB2_9PROT|nr:D-amino acid aminotransferase [Chitinivorax tropicus]MBB5019965.1 D-alanine transaminase [Chitinivorax tropicus]
MIYLNGQWQSVETAQIAVLDRGFLFGDGIYEVIPVYSRHPFRLDEHLGRLEASLASVRLTNPHPRETWRELVLEAISRHSFDDQSVYLQVTRGAGPNRDFPFPTSAQPSVFIYPMPLTTPSAETKAKGVSAITKADIRWLRCDIKAIALLANVLLRNEALAAGCAESVLLRDGMLTEGAASNIFVVKDGLLLAPPKSHLMLSGITYDLVLELAKQHGVPHEIRPVSEAEIRTADELWMTSSTKEVLAITTLDGFPVGTGRPGPMNAQMDAYYQTYKDSVLRQGGDT